MTEKITVELSGETYLKLKDQILAEENKIKEKSVKKLEIKNRFTGEIIWAGEKTTMKEAVEEADLHEAKLRGADLHEADLHEANLHKAKLSEANLREANLRGANLSEANLHEADLSEANLSEANLSGANLSGAKLSGANLSEANLSGADLMYAKFYGKGGKTKILKSQIPDFLKALGVIAE